MTLVDLAPGSGRFPTARSVPEGRDQGVDPLTALPALLRLAQARADWLGERLREQIERDGLAGVVGEVVAVGPEGLPVRVGEFARQLADLEHRERVTAERLARDMLRLDLEARAGRADAASGALIVAALRAFAEELGVPWEAEATRGAARAAVLAVRRQAGYERPGAADHGQGA
ncbi:hypothetical protein Q5530_05565 [Saccharothrix sp. BKS2]|uniref:hypothetical protein n=1 Tax=Saccharothrix sp. BKS2 TaxID=3064400 RepID=UPI0039E7AAB7